MQEIDYGTFDSMSADGLSLVSQLVAQLRELAADIARREAELAAVKATHDVIEQKGLPNALKLLGLAELTLSDGCKLTIKQDYYAGIPAPKREAALGWLRANGLGDIIKTELSVIYGRGEEARAFRHYQALRARAPERKIELAPTVHPSTLKALAKELHEDGRPLPDEFFSVLIVERVRLTSPRATRLKE